MLRPIPIKLCHAKEMCRPRSPGLPLRLGRSPTLESRVREWPGCFPVDLTKTRVFWEGKPQLWTCLHQIVFWQVCSTFSWIMTYVGGPNLGSGCRPWTGGPELYKKVEHATRNSFSPCLCISCKSPGVFEFFPWLSSGMGCSLKAGSWHKFFLTKFLWITAMETLMKAGKKGHLLSCFASCLLGSLFLKPRSENF